MGCPCKRRRAERWSCPGCSWGHHSQQHSGKGVPAGNRVLPNRQNNVAESGRGAGFPLQSAMPIPLISPFPGKENVLLRHETVILTCKGAQHMEPRLCRQPHCAAARAVRLSRSTAHCPSSNPRAHAHMRTLHPRAPSSNPPYPHSHQRRRTHFLKTLSLQTVLYRAIFNTLNCIPFVDRPTTARDRSKAEISRVYSAL